jgi:hypothetical protein
MRQGNLKISRSESRVNPAAYMRPYGELFVVCLMRSISKLLTAFGV